MPMRVRGDAFLPRVAAAPIAFPRGVTNLDQPRSIARRTKSRSREPGTALIFGQTPFVLAAAAGIMCSATIDFSAAAQFRVGVVKATYGAHQSHS
jgi:hypothetical protein